MLNKPCSLASGSCTADIIEAEDETKSLYVPLCMIEESQVFLSLNDDGNVFRTCLSSREKAWH